MSSDVVIYDVARLSRRNRFTRDVKTPKLYLSGKFVPYSDNVHDEIGNKTFCSDFGYIDHDVAFLSFWQIVRSTRGNKIMKIRHTLAEMNPIETGGAVVFATDDFFAPCEGILSDTEPVFIADKYTEFGKWMDGWETRRKRITGHDWCIIKLAAKCVIKGLLVDTAFFTGNNAPKFSIQAACLTAEEEQSMPPRDGRMGSACSEFELHQIKGMNSDLWDEIVPVTPLTPGYDDTRFNFQKVISDEAWTHIRVNIYPDGGIARLRVYGEAKPEPPQHYEVIDLISLLSGATCQGYSNAHYGHPKNMIKPRKSSTMADGWETARRNDRPAVIEANEDGTLKVPGQEWAVFKLGFPGSINKICVDTAHFKGNYPDSVKIEGANLGSGDWSEQSTQVSWQNILKPTKLSADAEHWFECNSEPVTHVRVTMAPDGGISRIRTFGTMDYGLFYNN